jgi:opacity protein-like surface antigen
MKNVLLASVAAASLLAGVPAQAEGMYAELFGGSTIGGDLGFAGGTYEMDYGYNVGATLGWELGDGLAWEVDGLFTDRNYSCCTTSLSSFSVMANLAYTIPIGPESGFNIGAGAGFVHVTYDGPGSSIAFGSDWTFGAQAFAGLSTEISQNLDLFGEVRYQVSDDAEIEAGCGGVCVAEYESLSLSVGLRFGL